MAARKVHIGFALVLAWLLPGLGHVYAGRRAWGAVYAGAVLGMLMLGVGIAGGTAVHSDLHPWYYLCQLPAGPLVIGINAMRPAESIVLAESISILRHQTGTVYVAVAGVLNLVVICELYRRHTAPEAPGPSDTMRREGVAAPQGGVNHD
jgi:hypothetical protein